MLQQPVGMFLSAAGSWALSLWSLFLQVEWECFCCSRWPASGCWDGRTAVPQLRAICFFPGAQIVCPAPLLGHLLLQTLECCREALFVVLSVFSSCGTVSAPTPSSCSGSWPLGCGRRRARRVCALGTGSLLRSPVLGLSRGPQSYALFPCGRPAVLE